VTAARDTAAVSSPARVRMTGAQRREQLLDVGRSLFAVRGYDGTSVEEIALRAGVSKPVVYEHFGGKEGLYAVVVDREVQRLITSFTAALTGDDPRVLLEQATLALLTYVEDESDGFRILVRESPVPMQDTGGYATIISDVAQRVEHILDREFAARGFRTTLAALYSQALVGMVALTGQWWLDAREQDRDLDMEGVAAHLVNLAWNGLAALETDPGLKVRDSSAGTGPEGDGAR
jgi:AcrR family transcriptional regulator